VTSDRIEARLAEITDRLTQAAERVGRSAGEVEILPVTKGHPASAIRAVRELGLVRIGENRVTEAEAKRAELGETPGVTWHMIGRLQRNKARRAAGLFDVIESIDSLRLAETLSRVVVEQRRPPLEILVQINPSGEVRKAGFAVEEALGAVRQICALDGLRVTGFMTMAPFGAPEPELRSVFRRGKMLLDRCKDEVTDFEGRVLSMGMSGDFEIAVEEGSTRVRLGTALLGER